LGLPCGAAQRRRSAIAVTRVTRVTHFLTARPIEKKHMSMTQAKDKKH
jgi:hypothetical protein